MKIDFNGMTRRFLMGEGNKSANPNALIQAVSEALGSLKPSSKRDQNKIAVAKGQLKEITRSFRKLQEQVNLLEEKLVVLEEASVAASIQGASGGAWNDEEVLRSNRQQKNKSKIKTGLQKND
jgi:hypothetical protein